VRGARVEVRCVIDKILVGIGQDFMVKCLLDYIANSYLSNPVMFATSPLQWQRDFLIRTKHIAACPMHLVTVK
jgi:hypothetical protein